MANKPPLRLALIGLSASAKTAWASFAHLPYLLSPRGKERYEIVALLNSSIAAAEAAKEHYALPREVRTYGDPVALAGDEQVDLVVCCTRVDTHYDSLLPSVQKGKDVFVEWPVAENSHRAAELASLANQSGSKVLVGLQLRFAPVVTAIRAFLSQGKIGKVLSSEITSAAPYGDRETMSEGLAYFLDRKVGGNLVTIMLAHMLDYVHSVVGEYVSPPHVHTQIQRPVQTILSSPEKRTVVSDVPDLISLHGTLSPSSTVEEGASLLVSFRRGAQFPGTEAFHWRIHGSRGELLVRAPRASLQLDPGQEAVRVEWWDFESDEVRDVEYGWTEEEEKWMEGMHERARGTGKLYDLFYEDDRAEERKLLVGLEEAVRRHREVDGIVYAS